MKQFLLKFIFLAVLLTLPVIIKAEVPESKEVDSLLRKASSFETEGNYKMACELYLQAIDYNDSISKIEYDKEVLAVRSENQIDEL